MCFIFFSLGKEFTLYLKTLSVDKYFLKSLQKTNALYSSASDFFISGQLILTVGQRRILGSVPGLFSAFLGETWHILLQDVQDAQILIPVKLAQ